MGGDGGGSVMCGVLQGCKAAVCYCNDQEHVLQYMHTVQLCISDLIRISSYLKWLPSHHSDQPLNGYQVTASATALPLKSMMYRVLT